MHKNGIIAKTLSQKCIPEMVKENEIPLICGIIAKMVKGFLINGIFDFSIAPYLLVPNPLPPWTASSVPPTPRPSSAMETERPRQRIEVAAHCMCVHIRRHIRSSLCRYSSGGHTPKDILCGGSPVSRIDNYMPYARQVGYSCQVGYNCLRWHGYRLSCQHSFYQNFQAGHVSTSLIYSSPPPRLSLQLLSVHSDSLSSSIISQLMSVGYFDF